MLSRKDYLKKLDSILKQLEEKVEATPRSRKTATIDRALLLDVYDYLSELTDMYQDFSINTGGDASSASASKKTKK